MSTTNVTFTEISESITGHDEWAVEQHFGVDVYKDGETKPMRFMRALIFVHLRHQNVPDLQARERVMSMPVREVNDYFAPEPDELAEFQPEGDPVGEGAGATESAPAS